MPTVQEHAAGGDQGAVSAKRRWVDRIRVPCLRFGRRKEKLTIDAWPSSSARPASAPGSTRTGRITPSLPASRRWAAYRNAGRSRQYALVLVANHQLPDDARGSRGDLGLPSRKAYSWDETWIGSGEAPKAVCYQPLVFVDVVDAVIGSPDYIEQVFNEGRQDMQEG